MSKWLEDFIKKLQQKWSGGGQAVTAMVRRMALVGTITIIVLGSVGSAYAVHRQVIGVNPWVCSADAAELCSR